MIKELYEKLLFLTASNNKTNNTTTTTPHNSDILDELLTKNVEQQQNQQNQQIGEVSADFPITDDGIILEKLTKEDYKKLVMGEKPDVKKRVKDNAKAREILDLLDLEKREPTKDEVTLLLKYTGVGGLSGSDDEYYTPKYVADAAWGLMQGVEDGIVLDPSSGTGIFGQSSPGDTRMRNIEYNKTSAAIAGVASPDTTTTHSSFEEESYRLGDNSVDGVITNVPFGRRDTLLDKGGRFASVGRYDHYFTIRSLELVKPKKRVVLVVPSGFISSTSYVKQKKQILRLGSFLGAIKLPNKVFSHTGANVSTDIVVFEKHPKVEGVNLANDGYSTDSVHSVIFENSTNESFLKGTYFKGNPSRAIGRHIKSEDYMESKAFDGHTRGDQCLTTDSVEVIKEKLLSLSKSKLINTTDYTLLEETENSMSLEAVSINSDIIEIYLRTIRSIKETLEIKTIRDLRYFNGLINVMSGNTYSGADATLAKLSKNKIENLNTLGLFDRTAYLVMVVSRGLRGLHFKEQEIKEAVTASLQIMEHGIKGNDKNIAYLQSNPFIVEALINKKEMLKHSKFKEGEINNHQEHNSNIREYSILLSNRILNEWDEEKRSTTKDDLIQAVGIDTILYRKGVSVEEAYKRDDEGNLYIDKKHFTKEEILESDELLINKDGQVQPFDRHVFNGALANSLEDFLGDAEYTEETGFTKEEFSAKRARMKELIEPYVEKIDTKNVDLTLDNAEVYFSASDIEKIKNIKQSLVDKRMFFFVTTDGESLDVPVSPTISQFFSKKNEDRMSTFFRLYEDEIKKAVGVSDFGSFWRKKQQFSKNADTKRDFLGRLLPIIMKHNMKELVHLNLAVDSRIKSNRSLNKTLSLKINRNRKISVEKDLASGAKLEHLEEFVSDEVLSTNHDFQNNDITSFSNSRGGIMAHDTGLGKTRIILLTALNAVMTGKSKRALIVVPTSLLGKWRMEVSLGQDGKGDAPRQEPIIKEEHKDLVAYVSNKDKSSWNSLRSNKKAKIIIMTQHAFAGLSFKDETLRELRGDTQKEIEANGGKIINFPKIPYFEVKDWETARTSKNSIGFFEGVGIDLLLVDEAHNYKNSVHGGGNYKFASSLSRSTQGNRMIIISELIKRLRDDGTRGCIYATATPFTSSPYEIFTMLKATGGLNSLNSLKEFEKAFMIIKREEVDSMMSDNVIMSKVFKGLTSLAVLKGDGLNTIVRRTVDTEKVRNPALKSIKPDYTEESDISIVTEEIDEKRGEILDRYALCKEAVKEGETDLIIKDRLLSEYGLSMDSVEDMVEITRGASPFSVTDKLNKLAIGSSVSDGEMRFDLKEVPQETQNELLEKLLKGKIKVKEKVEKVDPKDGSISLVDRAVSIELSEIHKTEPLIVNEILTIPALDQKLSKMILANLKEYRGVLDIEDFPKYKSLLENIKALFDNNNKSKQIIFSTNLVGANYIEYLVTKLFDDMKIKGKILNSNTVDSTGTDASSTFQKDYNTSSSPTVLIFTKKFTAGVDFNIMTEAVHLVDIPYTPDVWHQAMGRGVRQGNKVKNVKVYKYSQEGTIDIFKEMILEEKSGWQEKVLLGGDENRIVHDVIDSEEIISNAIAEDGDITEESFDKAYQKKKDKLEQENKEAREIMNSMVKGEVQDSINIIKAGFENSAYRKKENLLKRSGYIGTTTNKTAIRAIREGSVSEALKTLRAKSRLLDAIKSAIAHGLKGNVEERLQQVAEMEVGDIRGSLNDVLKEVFNKIDTSENVKSLSKEVEDSFKIAKESIGEVLEEDINAEEILQSRLAKALEESDNEEDLTLYNDLKNGNAVITEDGVIRGEDVRYKVEISDRTYYLFGDTLVSWDGKAIPTYDGIDFVKTSKDSRTYKDTHKKYQQILATTEVNKELSEKYFKGRLIIPENLDSSVEMIWQDAVKIKDIIGKGVSLITYLEKCRDFTIMKNENSILIKKGELLFSDSPSYRWNASDGVRELEDFSSQKLNRTVGSKHGTIESKKLQDVKWDLFEKHADYSTLSELSGDEIVDSISGYLVEMPQINTYVKDTESEEVTLEELYLIFTNGDENTKANFFRDVKDGNIPELKMFTEVMATGSDEKYWRFKYSNPSDAEFFIEAYKGKLSLVYHGGNPLKTIRPQHKDTVGVKGSKRYGQYKSGVMCYNSKGKEETPKEWQFTFSTDYKLEG